MTQFTRTIDITCSEDLGGSSAPTLILTFDDQLMKSIYKDYFHVVWKFSNFPTAGSGYAMTGTYESQLTFVNPQVENDKASSAGTWIKINLEQKTDLIEQSGSTTESTVSVLCTFIKSAPSPTGGAGDKYIKANNKIPTPQTIGVGFDNGGTPPPSLLLFKDIGSTYNVTAEFTPTLSAYITADYQEDSVVRGAIQMPAIWKQNLAVLKETSNWRLTRDPLSGIYSINPA